MLHKCQNSTGFHADCGLSPLLVEYEAGAQLGSSQGRQKRWHQLRCNALYAQQGPTSNVWHTSVFRLTLHCLHADSGLSPLLVEHEAGAQLGSSQGRQKRWHWLPASPDDHFQWGSSDVWGHWPPAGQLASLLLMLNIDQDWDHPEQIGATHYCPY